MKAQRATDVTIADKRRPDCSDSEEPKRGGWVVRCVAYLVAA